MLVIWNTLWYSLPNGIQHMQQFLDGKSCFIFLNGNSMFIFSVKRWRGINLDLQSGIFWKLLSRHFTYSCHSYMKKISEDTFEANSSAIVCNWIQFTHHWHYWTLLSSFSIALYNTRMLYVLLQFTYRGIFNRRVVRAAGPKGVKFGIRQTRSLATDDRHFSASYFQTVYQCALN